MVNHHEDTEYLGTEYMQISQSHGLHGHVVSTHQPELIHILPTLVHNKSQKMLKHYF